MPALKGVIFDCDGVLFESRRANIAFYNDILAHFDEAPLDEDDKERIDFCHTAASPEVLAALLGEERRQQALAVAARVDYRKFIPFMTPEPGLYDVLDQLSAVLPLAIATNRGTSMPDILDHFDLGRYFAAVVTSRDVDRPKPYPDMLLLAAERLAVPTGDLLFVGDSVFDRSAAEGAGVGFAAYKGLVDAPLQVASHEHLMAYVLERE